MSWNKLSTRPLSPRHCILIPALFSIITLSRPPTEHTMKRSAAVGDNVSQQLACLSTEDLERLLLSIKLPPHHSQATFRNWGKTYRCRPDAVFVPEKEEQCQAIIELAQRKRTTVRACGAGHSPSDLACTSGFLLRTDKLDQIIEVSLVSTAKVPRDAPDRQY